MCVLHHPLFSHADWFIIVLPVPSLHYLPGDEDYFDTAVFRKSQNYGGTRPIMSHHRAGETSYRFCIYLYWFLCAWDPGGKITGYFGYGPEYEVAINSLFIDTVLTRTTNRNPSHPVQLFLWRALFPKYPCPYTRRSCSRRDTDLTRPRARCSSATSLRLAHLDLPSFLYISLRV